MICETVNADVEETVGFVDVVAHEDSVVLVLQRSMLAALRSVKPILDGTVSWAACRCSLLSDAEQFAE